jgi:AraC family transcriptional regulator
VSLGGRDGGKARLKAGEMIDVRVSRRDEVAPSLLTRTERRARRTTNAPDGPRLAPWQERLAKELMRAHLHETISISDLARACRLSMSHFVRAFTQTAGVAPYSWFIGQRVLRAKELMAQSHLPLAEIALECGFVDQSHFTNTFVRRIGTTPLQWRRQAWGERSLPGRLHSK